MIIEKISFEIFFILESKRSRISKKKRSLSPSIVSPPSVTLNILSSNKTQKKRRPIPTSQSLNNYNSSPNFPISKVEVPQSSSLIRPIQYPIQPPIDPRNPVTWNVNDVCWYLNESGCSFAMKTIKEQVKRNFPSFKSFDYIQRKSMVLLFFFSMI